MSEVFFTFYFISHVSYVYHQSMLLYVKYKSPQIFWMELYMQLYY